MVWKEPGKDKDPWSSAQRPPDLERMVKSLHKRLGWLFGGQRSGGGQRHFHAATLWWLVPVIIAAWLISGFYKVPPGNSGVHYVFGRYTGVAEPGLHWHAPWPVGRADIIPGVEGRDYAHSYNRLLTGDGNVVVVDALVHYHVTDMHDYLFHAATPATEPQNPDAGAKVLLAALVDAAVRGAVAQSTLANLMGGGRDAVEADALKQLNAALQPYDAGIAVTRLAFPRVSVPEAVSSSDADVQGAHQDASQAEDKARAYADNLLPQAQAEADAQIKEAQAYHDTLISQAQADTARFEAVLTAYRKAPALTREELYVQTMEDILANADKVIVDTRNGSVTVQLGRPFTPAPTAASTSAKAAAGAAPPAVTATPAPAAGTRGGA